MNTIEKLGFDNWFWSSIPSGKDKVDFIPPCHGATVATREYLTC